MRNYKTRCAENYPTHELGPIAKVLNINRGNRMIQLSSVASRAAGLKAGITGFGAELFIIDDPIKNRQEADSETVRSRVWEEWTNSFKTRLAAGAKVIIISTPWHEDDLIGKLIETERCRMMTSMSDIDKVEDGEWLYLNFEALKASPATEIDPRNEGEALWQKQHSRDLLLKRRKLDPQRFEAMYQGHPASREGLLYSSSFREYSTLPRDIVKRGNYTDTADTGSDYLCSVCYAVDSDGAIYLTDVVYTTEPMEISERLVAAMLTKNDTRIAYVESNTPSVCRRCVFSFNEICSCK